MRRLVILLAFALVPLPASAADTIVVHRKSGGTIEGEIAREDPGFLEIRTKFGIIRVERSEILKVEKGHSLQTEFATRRKALAATNGPALLDLGRWAEKQGLWQEARATYLEALEIAGPAFAEAKMRLALLALEHDEIRLAVDCLSDLATRLRKPEAIEMLRKAEDRLMTERGELWRKAEKARAAKQWPEAIRAYQGAYARATREEPAAPLDAGRKAIRDALRACRREQMEAQAAKLPTGAFALPDRKSLSAPVFPRPADLRAATRPIPFDLLRIDAESLVHRWLAVRGVCAGPAAGADPAALAIRLDPEDHPEIAVVAYTPEARAEHEKALLAKNRKDAYLESLLRPAGGYAYERMAKDFAALAPGAETVCYGRLLKRSERVPTWIFEVWAVDATQDPEAVMLAEGLKRPLRCALNDTPFAAAAEYLTLITRAPIEYEGGQAPEIRLTLTDEEGRPAVAFLDRLAAESGLKWTRRGGAILFKKTLDPAETTLQAQVKRLVTDTEAAP